MKTLTFRKGILGGYAAGRKQRQLTGYFLKVAVTAWGAGTAGAEGRDYSIANLKTVIFVTRLG